MERIISTALASKRILLARVKTREILPVAVDSASPVLPLTGVLSGCGDVDVDILPHRAQLRYDDYGGSR
jgi:hypothetical protein